MATRQEREIIVLTALRNKDMWRPSVTHIKKETNISISTIWDIIQRNKHRIKFEIEIVPDIPPKDIENKLREEVIAEVKEDLLTTIEHSWSIEEVIDKIKSI